MQNFITVLALIGAAMAASSDSDSSLPPSSSIQIVPTSFIYSNTSAVSRAVEPYSIVDVSSTPSPSSVAASSTIDPSSVQSSGSASASDSGSASASVSPSNSGSSKQRSTIYEYATATDTDEEEITSTVCGTGGCYVTTELASKTTYTTTVDGVWTEITSGVIVSSTPTDSSLAPAETDSSSSDPVSSSSSFPNSTTTESPAVVTGHITESRTATVYGTTVVTITSCSDNKCSTYTTAEAISTETTTPDSSSSSSPSSSSFSSSASSVAPVESTETVQPESVETSTKVATTVITITSCSDNKCTEVPATTGLTTVTENDTIYTTYCPLSGETQTTVTSTSSEAPAPTSTEVETTEASPAPITTQATTITKTPQEIPTVDVITDNIKTEAAVSTLVLSTSSASPQVTTLSAYEGGAARISGAFALAGSILFMLI